MHEASEPDSERLTSSTSSAGLLFRFVFIHNLRFCQSHHKKREQSSSSNEYANMFDVSFMLMENLEAIQFDQAMISDEKTSDGGGTAATTGTTTPSSRVQSPAPSMASAIAATSLQPSDNDVVCGRDRVAHR